MPTAIGKTRWAIAEGYLPPADGPRSPQITSHETACLLNAGAYDAHVRVTIYFADRGPAGPYCMTVPARRAVHLRFSELRDPEPIPHDTDYASVFESDRPIIVQHSRLDSRYSELLLLTSPAYAER